MRHSTLHKQSLLNNLSSVGHLNSLLTLHNASLHSAQYKTAVFMTLLGLHFLRRLSCHIAHTLNNSACVFLGNLPYIDLILWLAKTNKKNLSSESPSPVSLGGGSNSKVLAQEAGAPDSIPSIHTEEAEGSGMCPCPSTGETETGLLAYRSSQIGKLRAQ